MEKILDLRERAILVLNPLINLLFFGSLETIVFRVFCLSEAKDLRSP